MQGNEFRLAIVEFDFKCLTETVNLGLWSGINICILLGKCPSSNKPAPIIRKYEIAAFKFRCVHNAV